MQFIRTEVGADPIIVEAYIAVPHQDVFRAWTDPQLVKKWFGHKPCTLHSAAIDLRVGGVWRFIESSNHEKTTGFEGEYLAIEIDRRLVFTWSRVIAHTSGEREATPESKVEIVLTPKGAGTDIHITHSAINDEPTRERFSGGWRRGISNLKVTLEEASSSS